MKTQIQKTGKENLNKFLITGSLFILMGAGWLIGNETIEAYSKSSGEELSANEDHIFVPAVAAHGEILTTIILKEFLVVAYKQ